MICAMRAVAFSYVRSVGISTVPNLDSLRGGTVWALVNQESSALDGRWSYRGDGDRGGRAPTMVNHMIRFGLPTLVAAASAVLILAGSARADVADQVIVGFDEQTSAAERVELRDRVNAEAVSGSFVADTQVFTVTGSRSEALAELRTSEYVEWAVADRVVRSTVSPGDPLFSQQWGLHNTGQTVNNVAGAADADIDAPEAWDIQSGDAAVKIGVVDTGISRAETDLAHWVNADETPGNGADDDGDGYVDDYHGRDFANNDADPADDQWHGTAVASVAAARWGFGPIVGSGRGQIVAAKALGANGQGSLSAATQAARYAAAQGARIVNISIGWNDSLTAPSNAALNQVYADYPETLFVIAAGNENHNADLEGDGAQCRTAAPNVICVASTSSDDERSSFSNWGTTHVDVGAPGSAIAALYRPWGVGQAALVDGTSFAAPMVAGAASLLLAERPLATARQMKAALIAGADATTPMAAITASGKRLNARGALQALPAVHAAAPTATAAPQITGTARVGQPLAAETGTWSGSPTVYRYRWQACDEALVHCTNLAGATAQTFTPGLALRGRRLRVQVYGQDGAGRDGLAYSALTTALENETPPEIAEQPSISDLTPEVRQVINAATGSTSNDATSTLTWQSCDEATCTTVGSGATYTVRDEDYGRTLRARVTWSNVAGVTTTSTGTAAVSGVAPTVAADATIIGPLNPGRELTVTSPTVTPGVPTATAISVHWERCAAEVCVTIGHGSSVTLTTAELGRSVRATISASNAAGSSSQTISAGTVTALPAPTIDGPLLITGEARVGSVLSAVLPGVTAVGAYTQDLQWEACRGATCTFVAEGARLTVPANAAGALIRITMAVRADGGEASVQALAGPVLDAVVPTLPPLPSAPPFSPITATLPRPTPPLPPGMGVAVTPAVESRESAGTLKPTRVAFDRSAALLTVECTPARGCRGTIALTTRRAGRLLTLGRARVRTRRGTATVRIRMSRAKLRLARRASHLRAAVTIDGETDLVTLRRR